MQAFYLIRKLILPLGVFILSGGCCLCAQDAWKLKKKKYGAKAFTAKKDDSKFVKYKVEGQIEGKLPNVVALMQDVTAYYDLFENTNEVYAIEDKQEAYKIFYLNTNAPWPAKDRAAVFENRYSYNHQKRRLTIEGNCIEKKYSKKSGTIQLPACGGYWQFTQIEEDLIDVHFEFWADPGGKVPAWIINRQIVDGPLHTFNQIKEKVLLNKYHGKSYQFLYKETKPVNLK